ncbi:MAG: sporulation protein YabP [Oscillospiraceae bacterium]
MNEHKSVSPQNIILENRSQLRISGVKDIDSFTESKVVIDTVLGELVIKGENLHINQLEQTTGDFSVSGSIRSLVYNSFPEEAGFFSRLFR